VFEPLADLERHARDRPTALALATPSREFTFAQLHDMVLSTSGQLHAGGVTAGALVAIDLSSALEWIVDLALFRLGARTVSIRGVEQLGSLPVAALVTEPGVRGFLAPITVEVDEHWIDAAVRRQVEPPAIADYPGAAYDFRLILTSGTTGSPRAAAYSVGAFTHRMSDGHLHWTDGRPELTMIGLSTTGGFHAAAAALRLGVPYLAIDRIDADSLRFAASHGIRVLCGSPVQVALALQVLAEAAIALPELEEVRLSGATPSPALLGLVAQLPGVIVRSVYGSTEGGGVTQVFLDVPSDPYAVGAALPGVELQVVDETGTPTTAEGLLRYRSPGLVSGYLMADAVVPFPDGWFVPGDRATLAPDGTLTLAGRNEEIFNLGGVKLDPVVVDRLALAFAGVDDAAAFRVERTPGIPEVGLAVVGPGCDLRALDQALRAALPVGHPTAYWRVDAIPRSRLGKPLRAQVAREFAAR